MIIYRYGIGKYLWTIDQNSSFIFSLDFISKNNLTPLVYNTVSNNKLWG